MATTDAKPGFRLPWSSDRSDSAPPAGGETSQADPTTPQERETPEMIDAAPAATDHEAAVAPEATTEPTPAPAPEAAVETVAPTTPEAATTPAGAPARKPNKFMADLTRAMQAAAETAREDTLARFSAEAKVHIEEIHTSSGSEATELRKRADDDVATIREWSKAEIARIREETDERISHRKERLEREIEGHAAAIEARVERVQGRVAAFEAEMAAFFERLLAEEDPTRFAAMAESLPEPPSFDQLVADEEPVVAAVEVPASAPPTTPVESVSTAEAVVTDAPSADAAAPTADAPAPETPVAAEPAADAWPTASDESIVGATTPVVEDTGDLFGVNAGATDAEAPAETDDPRLAMLGMAPDFAAAEAEAATFAPIEDGSDEPVAEIADEALAARLAGLVPEADPTTTETVASTLVVTGLVSVASIAGFKRHLSRVTGVRSVGVSSGPDGEFVFAVSHDPSCTLRDAVATLPGFGARVTGETEMGITVAAHDPEAEA